MRTLSLTALPHHSGSRLADDEFAKLFTVMSEGGSPAELLLLRVVKRLTLVMVELHQVSVLEADNLERAVVAEVEYLIAIDRAAWYRQQMDAVEKDLSLLGRERSQLARRRRYVLRSRLDELRDGFLLATNQALKYKDQLVYSLHEKDQIELLRTIQRSLIMLGMTYTKKEGELSK